MGPIVRLLGPKLWSGGGGGGVGVGGWGSFPQVVFILILLPRDCVTVGNEIVSSLMENLGHTNH